MKERVLLQGVISDLRFPCKGKFMPAAQQPESINLEPPAGISYVKPEREYAPISVKNLLPEQEWIVSTGKGGRNAKECHPIMLVKRAPYETEAPCPHAAFCGGCLYQTVPYEKQLQWKEAQVKELLSAVRKYGLDAVPFKYKFKFILLMLRANLLRESESRFRALTR